VVVVDVDVAIVVAVHVDDGHDVDVGDEHVVVRQRLAQKVLDNCSQDASGSGTPC